MNSHHLANLLLSFPNLPIATHANNHDFVGGIGSSLKVGLLKSFRGDHIVIGNMTKRNLNRPNWYISEMYFGSIPEN